MATMNNVKDYWNLRPCNIRHSDKPIGTKEYFEEVEKKKYTVEPHIPGFASFNNWTGKKVLEIGCGIGTDTINFARAGANVTAIEYSIKSLEIAQARAELLGLKIKFYHANAEELSRTVPVEKYDLVYSFGVIHHTLHPEYVISEIKKYMGPDSVLKLMLYHRNSWKVLLLKLMYPITGIDALISENSEAQFGCPITYAYTKRTAKKLLSGFRTKIRIDHIFPYQIGPYKRHEYKRVWYFA